MSKARMARQKAKFIIKRSGKKTLRSFNIYVGRLRTTVRLSPVEAEAVEKIAARERCKVDDVYTYIERTKERGVSRATAIREFALRYFIEAGTMAGHRKAGHGNLITKRARPMRDKRLS